jgi:hypothetical protein
VRKPADDTILAAFLEGHTQLAGLRSFAAVSQLPQGSCVQNSLCRTLNCET